MKTVRVWVHLIFSACMLVLCAYGGYSLAVMPARAKAARAEVEEMLRENQRKAEEKQRQIEEQKKKEEAERKAELDKDRNIAFLPASELHVVGIGDSVMLAALPQLYEEFPNGYFDAVFGRTIYEGINALKKLEAEDKLGDVLVFSLGANCYIKDEDVEELIAHSGGRPTFWLSTYGVTNDSNEVTKRVIAKHDNAYYIDWESLALPNKAKWILPDALHPNAEGSKAYAELIDDTITKELIRNELRKIFK